jgi:hypothetical protein
MANVIWQIGEGFVCPADRVHVVVGDGAEGLVLLHQAGLVIPASHASRRTAQFHLQTARRQVVPDREQL